MGTETTYSGVIGWLSWFCSALNAQDSARVEVRRVASGVLPLTRYEFRSEKQVEPGLMPFRGQQARTPKLLPTLGTVHPAADADFTQ